MLTIRPIRMKIAVFPFLSGLELIKNKRDKEINTIYRLPD